MSSTEESEVARPTGSFRILDLKDYDIAEETINYIHVNHMIKKPKIVYAEAEENLSKAELKFMVKLKSLLEKTSVDPNTLQLKNCLRNIQKERAPEQFSPVLTNLTEQFGLLFAGDKMVVPEEIKKRVKDALHFGHPKSTKVLAESKVICWAGMQKDIKWKHSTGTACMSSGKKLTYQSPMTKNINLTVLTEMEREREIDFYGKLEKNHLTGET